MNTLFYSMIAALMFVNAGLYGMEKGGDEAIFPGSGSSSSSSSPQSSRESTPGSSPSGSPRLDARSEQRSVPGCPPFIDVVYFELLARRSVALEEAQKKAAAEEKKSSALEHQ
jgi:hypothetical protein